MAEELRLAFMLLGSLAIGAVILHGIWTVRKNVSEEKLKNKQPELETPAEDDLDEEEIKSLKLKQMEMNFADLDVKGKSEEGLPVASVNLDSIYQESEASDSEGVDDADIQDEQVVDTEATINDRPFTSELPKDEPQLAFVEQETDHSSEPVQTVEQDVDLSNQLVHSQETRQEHHGYQEPELGSFTALDDEDAEPLLEQGLNSDPLLTEQNPANSSAEPEKQDVLILFIDKGEGESIEGAKLLPLLLTLGFKFGEMDFFHRHESNSGKGEVLFSLANMYNPGTFDIDHMEQMTTRGLSIFMTLPNAGEALQTFNMMHNAAKKIADEFGASVLDQHRNPLDVSIVRGYVERIRKF